MSGRGAGGASFGEEGGVGSLLVGPDSGLRSERQRGAGGEARAPFEPPREHGPENQGERRQAEPIRRDVVAAEVLLLNEGRDPAARGGQRQREQNDALARGSVR